MPSVGCRTCSQDDTVIRLHMYALICLFLRCGLLYSKLALYSLCTRVCFFFLFNYCFHVTSVEMGGVGSVSGLLVQLYSIAQSPEE